MVPRHRQGTAAVAAAQVARLDNREAVAALARALEASVVAVSGLGEWPAVVLAATLEAPDAAGVVVAQAPVESAAAAPAVGVSDRGARPTADRAGAAVVMRPWILLMSGY
jgi:hypothetical protein